MTDGNAEKEIDRFIGYIRRTHGLIIGELMAEEAIRRSVLLEGVIEVKGRDATTGWPRAATIPRDDVRQAIRD
jgi:actin-like ATPase involved in cell morphogenesis